MQMKGLTITRPNWGRYHVFSTSYPPDGPAGHVMPCQYILTGAEVLMTLMILINLQLLRGGM